MKKQYIVKDKDKLFKKLFISPSYCEPLDPPLLVSPDFINLLLQQSAKAQRVYQIQIINDILNVFAQRPTNSLLLCAHDQTKLDVEKCILDSIVLRVLNLISTEQQVELYLERVVLMLSYYRISLRNFRKLTQWLSKTTYIQKFDPIKLMFIIRLMKLYYSKKLGQSKSPSHYFYIFGTDNSGIQPIQHASNELCFKNELTIILSFNSQGESSKPYNLFLIKTEKSQQVALTYSKGSLKITALYEGEFLDQFVIIKSLSDQVWYRLIINLNTSQTECIIDNQTYTGRALLKKQRQRKIIGCMFGRQFFGMIGNVLVSNKNIPLQKFDINTFPYGIDSIDHLIALNKTSIPASSICSCLPFYTFEVRQVLHCFDVFHRNHSSISDNVVTVGLPISEQTIQHMGGCSILLPLFYIARFYNKAQYPSILQDLLSIIIEIMSSYNIDRLEIQFQETNFLQILGQHLGDIPHLQTSKSLNIILAIFKKLKKQQTKLVFLRDVIWNLNVGIQVPYAPLHQAKQVEPEPETVQDFKNQVQSLSPTKILKDLAEDLIAQYYKTIITIYNTESRLAYNSMSFAEITYWAVQRLEANRSMIFACCLQHHLNQAVLEYQMKVKQLVRLDASHFRIHYHYLQEILSNYLEIQIKKSDDHIIEHFKTLLRLLLQKYSACFYVMVLKVIKRQIISFGGNKEICRVLLDPKLQITSFLIFLSQKTINPDIISQILYILLFIYKHSSTKKKEEVIKFIVNLLKINQQMLIKITNPIKNVVMRVRKNSLPNLKRQEEQFEQPQVPLKRTNSYMDLKPKNIMKNTEKQRLSRIISRSPKPEKISSHQILYNIIMNQLSNAVSQSEPTTQGIFYSEQSILILKQYYKIAQPIFKQSILLFVLASLQKNPQLKNLKSLTLFLLECLKQSIYTSPQQTKNLLTIFTCIFSQIITNHGSIVDYYSSIKYLKTSRIAISLVLPHVISKVIKLADMSQLCQLLMVCLYQMTQSTQDSALQMSLMVFCQINDKILKYFSGVKQGLQNHKKIIQKMENCQLFNLVICQSLQKQTNIQLSDPFDYIVEQKKENGQNVDFQLKNVTNQFQIVFPEQKNTGIEQVKVEQVQNDEINGIRNKLNIFSRKQRSKSKSKSPRQQTSKVKKQSSQSSNTSIDSLSNKSQKQKNTCYLQYAKQLTALEIYIKLFFKSMEKLQIFQQKEEKKTKEEKQSFIRRTKSAQISYSYQFKSKQILIKQFAQIMSIYFQKIIFTSKVNQKGFIKFILSYLIYKNQKVKQTTSKQILKSGQILSQIISSTILPFVNENTKDFHDLSYAISGIDAKTIFVSYFTRSPFQFKIQDFKNWNKDKTKIIDSFSSETIYKIFIQDEKFNKFFNSIDDNHDLLIVGFYQKNMQKFVEDYENLMTNFNSQAGFKNIQKLFDTENSAQQKTRITFLYENQCKFRKYHYEWDKLWNKLRTYHQPYGFWMAQKFKDSIYTYPTNQIRNFKFQMSQYSSTVGMYPVLEAKILQPWTIVKDNRIKKNIYINSFSQMMKPSHIKTQKTHNQSQNSIFTNVWKGMLGLSKKNAFNFIGKQKVKEYDVVLISRSTKATGKLFIQHKQDLIFCYQGARQQDTHLSFQKFSLAFNRQTYQKWSFYSIDKIKVHRYLLKYQALQMIFCDGRSVIFHFYKDDKQQFIKQVEKIQRQKMQANGQKLYKLNKISFLMDNFFEYKGLDPKITQSWIKRQISNLQYLIKLNRAASRGIFDLSQYMVVPWVVQFKKQKQPAYRDLSKTMGGLGSEQRKKIISEKYYTKDPFNPYPPFFFGTHYSSPGVVFNFLIRLSPFTEYCKHLQGGKFDIPDRLFSSIVSAWRSASEQVSDVRQLIPQMYYLPELFINIDENYFGYTQNAQLINHVQIPPWGANNPYFFTSQLRQIMESQQISQKINQWIDLIFGFKQKGKQAQQNYNIYYYLTYQDHKDVDDQEDDVYVKSKQAQIVHFGQIPPQIFEKPHPKRNSGTSEGIYQLKVTRSINLMNSLKQKPIGIRVSNNQLFICKRNQFEVYSIQSNPASLQKKKKFNFEKSMTQTYFLIKKQKSNVYLLQKPFFIVWGYMSNQFRIVNKNTGEIDQSDEMPSKILSLHVNKDEDLILIGSQSGILAIYQIQYGLNDIFLKKIGVQVFPAPIVHISQFDGFFTITFGNYTSIYKIHRSLHYLTNSPAKATVKFFRSFYNPIPLKASYIMGSPLYSIILIDNANIKSYSINGQFIKSINSAARYYGRFKDSQLHDVFYAVDDDKIICYSVPDLRNISILELPECQQVIGNYILFKSSIDEVGYVCE